MVGGEDIADRLRLSKAETRALDVLQSDMSPQEIGYRHGVTAGVNKLAIEAASLGQLIDPNLAKTVDVAASATFPLKAADLMETHQGPALGAALKAAEARWIASGFTLTKDALLG